MVYSEERWQHCPIIPNPIFWTYLGLEEFQQVQVWLELDELLRTLGRSSPASVPVPSQILGLLPPPPAGGWPDAFALADVAAKLAERNVEGDDEKIAGGYVEVDERLSLIHI